MKSGKDVILVGGFQEMIELCEECGVKYRGNHRPQSGGQICISRHWE